MKRTFPVLLLALFALAPLAGAQETPVRVLVIDETKTFQESLQVNALAGLLKGNPTFEVAAKLAEVASPLDLPLQHETLETTFDLVVLVPLDLGRGKTVWLFGRPYFEQKEPQVAQAAQALRGMLSQVFAPQGAAVRGVGDDLFPAIVAGYFLKHGWL